MATKRFTMGPGTLTLGAGSDYGDISAQVTNMRVEWSESTTAGDDVDTLDGGTLTGDSDTSYAAVLAGNVVQDIDANGLVEWSWLNKGEEVPFVFVPNTVAARAVTGTTRVGPITLGGDVKDKTPRSDISWPCVGDPALGAAV